MKRSAKIVGLVTAGTLAAMATAPAASASTGTNPLINVLTADGDTFDNRSSDFDIVTEAAKAVLAAKPASPVAVLADGSTAVTAFIPTDQAFRLFVWKVTGKWYWSEEKVFEAVAGLGIDTVEKVLLYHVVPGATIDSAAALNADGAQLTTAEGQAIGVKVYPTVGVIKLVDEDPDARDPRVIAVDINKESQQIAHGINRVLRPVDL